MKTIAPDEATEAEKSDFKPLTAQQAQEWRERQAPLSVWRLLAGQAMVGMLVALLAWGLTGHAAVGWSAACGALAVVLPAALFARAVLRPKAGVDPRAVLLGFVGWELAKIMLTLALLAAAVQWVPGLSWVALLVGMASAMKMYWVALWVWPGVRKTVSV
ncbi:ATP synthase subunit I [Verminephrobacter eiseniae]|uniref:ATP synthase subunit I n=1 Tax=Verminephrobacter eiseniae TaxID=364317 RepID=UPI002238800D|nr:ATP synthase subunit I [Verminephrobacter eiseniae]MCW5235232.1 ATP synthase subunit I [Verminephrobacter eiseniae]